MQKNKVFCLALVVISIGMLMSAISYKVIERKRQLICEGNLHHWRSAFLVYRKNAKSDIALNERVELLESLLYSKHVKKCPSAKEGEMNYRIDFVSKQKFLIFDAEQSKISYRHLGCANFLQMNDSQENFYTKMAP